MIALQEQQRRTGTFSTIRRRRQRSSSNSTEGNKEVKIEKVKEELDPEQALLSQFCIADFGTTKNKIDLRPRTFLSVMKVEIILLIFGVGFAISTENNKIFVYFITCSPPILFSTSSCKTKRTR